MKFPDFTPTRLPFAGHAGMHHVHPPPPTQNSTTNLTAIACNYYTGKVILTETSLYLKWLRLNICPSRKLRFKLMFFCDGECAISCTLVKFKQIIKELCKEI